ncbi:receptor-like protein EIX2 [Triticum dicoccoides]|uniref:receptor-like protein EIX2 n=1 Tax=Triticum dicoccoides TaxID=85692 RepID=UPI001891D26F|nr:receptor-like protein EIX2 [Triticum dicoccoides]
MSKLTLLIPAKALLLCLLISQAASTSHGQAQPSVSGACVNSERDALLSFKASLFDPAGRLSSWRHGDDCCQWKGVRCSNRTGHVIKLNLRNIDMDTDGYPNMRRSLSLSAGEMSSSLATLQQLRYLDLSYNDFNSTSIPVFMGSLGNLRYLNLSWALFSGIIPSQLGNLSKLQHLDVSWNFGGLQVVDLAWLPRLSLLTHLDMSSVDLSFVEDWVHTFNMLPSLKVLCLFECGLNSTMPGSNLHSKSNLTHLEVFDMSENYFFGTSFKHNWFWNLTSLKELDLFGCGWNGSIPNELRNMKSLQVLNLGWNNLKGLLPTNLENLCDLKVLILDANNINANMGEFLDRLPRCSWNTLHKLSVVETNMTGNLPVWIGNMTNLSVLRAFRNMMTGPLPIGIGALGKLKELDLGYNNINGVLLKDHFTSLGNIESLRLSSNNFSGVLFEGHFACLGNLKFLDLSYNNFSGVVLKRHSTSLGNLKYLDLSYNKLNSVLTEEDFAGLLNLEYLDLSYNSLKLAINQKWVPPFRLKVAGFRSCHLGPHFPEWLKWQTGIDVLVLGNSNLDDVIPDWFWLTFSRASFLHASGNKLHGSLPENLQHMAADHIYLGSNNLTGQVPLLPINIVRLNLSSNSFSGALSSDLKAPFLEELLLANNQIGGMIPSSLCRLTSLKRLDLSGNKFTGDVMQCFKEFGANSENQFGSQMLSLALNNNDLSGEFPKILQSASQLKFLDLSYNSFSGGLPMWLPKKMPLLQILRLRSNTFTGHIPGNLTSLARLHYLDISGNNISGSIPWSLSNLKAMKTIISKDTTEDYNFEESIPVITKDQKRDYSFQIYKLLVNLDLSSNSLTGQIPKEISLLIALTNLNISSNQLTGTIPNQIGDLKHLESLDLSYNIFSGAIPSGLSALTSLSHLNLSYNNLSGAIPSGPQLQTLENQMYIYIGNPGLCGPPLSKNCSANEAQQSSLEDINHMSSVYLATSIGFVVGLWIVFCTMLMKRAWRAAYFQFIDELYDKVYVQVVVRWARLMQNTRDDAP